MTKLLERMWFAYWQAEPRPEGFILKKSSIHRWGREMPEFKSLEHPDCGKFIFIGLPVVSREQYAKKYSGALFWSEAR